jgi:peptide/nickel transport system permease protein
VSSSNFGRYIAGRLLQTIPLVFVVILVNFLLIHTAPGDPAEVLGGQYATADQIQFIRHYYGLDKPLLQQFLQYLWLVIHGNLGTSIVYNQPVLNVIADRIGPTLLLMGTGLAFASIFGIILGVVSASRKNSITDNTVSIVSLTAYSVPAFWTGIVLIIVFAGGLHVFPSHGMATPGLEAGGLSYAWSVLQHLILPSTTVGLVFLGLVTRLTRDSMLTALADKYIVTARSKGLSERIVLYKHALRNAILPVVTVIGFNAGYLLAGAVVTETIFGWPGMGFLIFNSLLARDYPVILGSLVVISVSVILANLLTDVVYAFLDPRIRYRGARV